MLIYSVKLLFLLFFYLVLPKQIYLCFEENYEYDFYSNLIRLIL